MNHWFLRAAVVAALLLVAPNARAALAQDGLQWAWSEADQRRWFVEVEVLMPSFLWFLADENREARVVAFRNQMILACGQAERESRRAWQIRCDIEDFGIQAAPLEGDRGVAQPILDEVDDKLTGAALQIVLRDDGRVVNIDLEGVAKGNRRESRMHETLRIMLTRSIAGFDLRLPRKGRTDEGVWAQYQSLIMAAPTDRGTQGSAEIAHLVRTREQGFAIIETAGRATISPGNDGGIAQNFYKTELESVAAFDTSEGMLRERVWTAHGKPTASSAIAEGGKGIDYLQRGRLLLLGEGVETPTVHETVEVQPPTGSVDSAILDWLPLGPDSTTGPDE